MYVSGLQSNNVAHQRDGGVATNDNNLRVLLVEDSSLLSERLLELLSDLPGVQTVAAATTEAEAIEAVQLHHPDAVILDLRLKEGTGFGVMRHINTLEKRPAVVIITNYALPQYRRQAEAMGVNYFLDKTQEFERLPKILESLLQSRTN
ncbi:MAG: response regulator [Steroidobacteraceae bacterium]